MKHLKLVLKLALCSVVVLAAHACESDDDESGHQHGQEESLADELCEHMAEGPAQSVTASDGSVAGPDVSTAHTRFDITLPLDGSTWAGVVQFAATEEGTLWIALSESIPVVVTDGNGQEITPNTTTTVPECAEINAIRTFPVVVGPYVLSIGPADTDVVQVVIELGHDNDSE